MPCDCSHMDQTTYEKESIKVAKLLIWVYQYIDKKLPEWVSKAAGTYYGEPNRIHDLTSLLCASCELLDDDILYNGRDREARKLATWWDDHKEADRIKEEKRIMDEAKLVEERIKRVIKIELRKQALAKLTPEEIEALKQ